jgi:hypothetical protein
LGIITIGFFCILAFAISCQPTTQAEISHAIGGSSDGTGGRYLYPVILSFFLGVMAVWILDSQPKPSQASADECPPATTKPKKRQTNG